MRVETLERFWEAIEDRATAIMLSPSSTGAGLAKWTLGTFDNITFETGSSGKEFLPFLALDAKGIQRSHRMFHKDLPVTFANTKSFMGSFHIASSVDGRPTKGCT